MWSVVQHSACADADEVQIDREANIKPFFVKVNKVQLHILFAIFPNLVKTLQNSMYVWYECGTPSFVGNKPLFELTVITCRRRAEVLRRSR